MVQIKEKENHDINLWYELINLLKTKKVLKTERVTSAMKVVDRFYYCKNFPYVDEAQDIGFKATTCAPYMQACILEMLAEKLTPGSKVLDVGSGSGFLTSCMAKLVGSNGLVIGVDHIREIVESSVVNISKGNPELFEKPNIRMYCGDGRGGVRIHAPYKVIFVGASVQTPPRALLQQLQIGGRLVIPIGNQKMQNLVIFDKTAPEFFNRSTVGQVMYSPLTDKIKQWPWNSTKKFIETGCSTSDEKKKKKKLLNI